MNDMGREVLIAAGLAGVPQGRRGWEHPLTHALCAQGVLIRSLFPDVELGPWGDRAREAHRLFWERNDAMVKETKRFYECSENEWSELSRRNDRGEDFLTIARKVGMGDDGSLL